MLKNPVARCVFRLFTLAIMLGALTLLVSTEKVNAGTIEECDRDFGYCLYDHCLNLSGPDFVACREACDLAYETCRFDDPYDPLPAPYPVITHNLQWCLQSCLACNSIADPTDRLACYTPCWDWCMENNPKP